MDDEIYEELVSETPEEAPAPEEVPAFEISPEPVEADPAPDPDPVEPSDPVEVVTVDDLLDRLTADGQENTQTEDPLQMEELPLEEDPVNVDSGSDLSAAIIDGGPVEVVGMDKVLNRLETIQQQTVDHPMMTTPFEDYTVTEGLLLLVFVILVLDFFLNILRRWF